MRHPHRGFMICALLAAVGCDRAQQGHAPSEHAAAPLSEGARVDAPPAHTVAPPARADALLAQSAPPAAPRAHADAAVSPRAAREPNAVDRALAYDPNDPLGELESADAIDRIAGTKAPAKRGKEPAPGTCVVLTEAQRVWPEPTPPAIARAGSGFVVAGYSPHEAGERLFLVRTALDAKPEPITAFPIGRSAKRARQLPPALAARDENELATAFVDGDQQLWVRRLRPGRAGHGAAVQVASGLDPRFAPALSHQADRTLVAWTVGSTPMHTQLASLSSDDRVLSTTDVTPHGLGAAAPTFVAGSATPQLIAIDARNGMSSILRIALEDNGTPKRADVGAAVGMVSSPPQLAAAATQDSVILAYTGIGSAATSAIGLVTLSPGATPRTLVPGVTYGPLHVSLARSERAVIAATDAGTSAAKDSRREIHVHVVRSGKVGPAAAIKGPSGAAHAALAYRSQGEVAVAYLSASGVYVAYLRCNDSDS